MDIFECAKVTLPAIGIFLGGLGYFLQRQAEERKAFFELLDLYYTPAVQKGSQRLWQLFRDSEKNQIVFLKAYLETQNLEQNKGTPEADQIHALRRQVTQFWRRLGATLQHKLCRPRIIYRWWSQSDVGIVDDILIALEDKIAQTYGASGLNPTTDPLYHLSRVKHNFNKTTP